jgi:hypothetical protein
VEECGWLSVAVEDVSWCVEVGLVAEETLDSGVCGLVEIGRSSVVGDDVVEVVSDVGLAGGRWVWVTVWG